MEKNTELLEKVKLHILEEPRRYDQTVIGTKSREAPCGTAGCLYGWGAVLGGLIQPEQLKQAGVTENEALFEMDEVSRLFGFTIDEGDIVMHTSGRDWASPYGERLRAARVEGDKEGEARAAADYLDYIIRTGNVTD